MPALPDRARAAFLGLALGDAFGRPLEFLRGEAVRTTPVDTTRLMWTDDTHMARTLAEAVLEVGPAFDADAFGAAWGRAVVRWSEDPLTPSTAPGNTCLAGARALRRGVPWTASGVTHSDGCGAVMRLAPLPMAWSGEDLDEALRISAIVTHAHPNAPAATVVLGRLLRGVLEDGTLDADRIRAEAARSRADGHPPVVAEALHAALDEAERLRALPPDAPLDEAAIPTGDGGWRSVSAMGLALAATLADDDLARIIERAARIDGDSDSVACLAGMLAGARDPDGLPRAWLPGLVDREGIAATADQMTTKRSGSTVA